MAGARAGNKEIVAAARRMKAWERRSIDVFSERDKQIHHGGTEATEKRARFNGIRGLERMYRDSISSCPSCFVVQTSLPRKENLFYSRISQIFASIGVICGSTSSSLAVGIAHPAAAAMHPVAL